MRRSNPELPPAVLAPAPASRRRGALRLFLLALCLCTAWVPEASAQLIRVEVVPRERTIAIGETRSMTAIGTFQGGQRIDITDDALWASSNPRVATVTRNRGQVTAVAPGTAFISASVGALSSRDARLDGRVTVPARVVRIRIEPREVALPVGFMRSLNAIATFNDNSEADITNRVDWASSDASIVRVSNAAGTKGEITTLRQGVESVSATDPTTGISSSSSQESTTVTVLGRIASITITPASEELSAGQIRTFSARAVLEDGSTFGLSRRTMLWSSSDSRIATVSNEPSRAGEVTARAPGVVVLSAVHAETGILATPSTITILDRLVSIAIEPVDRRLDVGEVKSMTAIGTFADGKEREVSDDVTWTSTDARVASISNSPGSRGKITGVRSGVAFISARFITGVTSSATDGDARVRVVSPLASLRVAPSATRLPVGFTASLDAIARFQDGTEDDVSSKVVWSSSNSAIASVSNEIDAQGDVTAHGLGAAVIGVLDLQTGISSTVSGGDSTINVGGQVVNLFVSPPEEQLSVGETRRYQVRAVLEDDSTFNLSRRSLEWSSSNVGVASIGNDVDEAGLVRGLDIGETQIGAFHPATGLTAEPGILTVRGAIVALRVSPRDRRILVGETKSMSATATFSDGTTGEVTDEVTWVSSDLGAVTVSNEQGSRGRITGVSPGLSFISVRASNGVTSTTGAADSRIRVSGSLVRIQILPREAPLAAGFARALEAEGTFSDGSVGDITNDVEWTSSNPGIVRVSNEKGAEGEVTALVDGTAIVTARDPATNISSTPTGGDVTVAVGGRVVQLGVNPSTDTIPIGISRRFSTRATLDNGSAFVVARGSVQWASSDPAVATVSDDPDNAGTVAAVDTGEVDISAVHVPSGLATAAFDANALVTVPGRMVGIEVRPQELGLFVGSADRLSAFAILSDGRAVRLGRGVQFISSNPGVATVSNASGARGDAIGIQQGVTSVSVVHPESGLASSTTDGDATLVVVGTPDFVRVEGGNRTMRTGNRGRLRAFGVAARPDTPASDPELIEVEMTDAVEWRSTDPTVVRIEENQAIAVGLGTAIVSARDPVSGVSSTSSGRNASFRVVAKLKRLRLQPGAVRTRVGATRLRSFEVIGSYSDGARLDITRDVEFAITDPGVAGISNTRGSEGQVTPVAPGRTTVTAIEPVTGVELGRAGRVVVKAEKSRKR